MIQPRYSCLFVSRFCPRSCSYCLSKDVRGEPNALGVTTLAPEQWNKAIHILEDHGIVFHCIIGNDLLGYPDPPALVRALNDFHGRYAIYSTFPPGWTEKYLDACIDAGLYNISSGVDVYPGLLTGDTHVDRKASAALHWLKYCKDRGVPDIQMLVTIHRHNYDKLETLFDLISDMGIWIGVSMIAASADGKHDFYGHTSTMQDWLIPPEERQRFHDTMHHLAQEIRKGRWLMHETPAYFEGVGKRELAEQTWHCSLPIIISVEEDGALRACSYRGRLPKRYTVFDLAEGGSLSMEQYVSLQQEATSACPGCSSNGAAWSYWAQAEEWTKGDQTIGDKIYQSHHQSYDFEKTYKAP